MGVSLLYYYIKNWFKNRTVTEQILIGIVLVLLIWLGYKGVVNDLNMRSNNKFLKAEEQRDKVTIDSLTLILKDLPKKGKRINKNSQQQSKKITDKLNQDEKTIDNRTVTDAMRKEFRAKHGDYND